MSLNKRNRLLDFNNNTDIINAFSEISGSMPYSKFNQIKSCIKSLIYDDRILFYLLDRIYLAGGAIASILNKDILRDADIFFKDLDALELFARYITNSYNIRKILGSSSSPHESDSCFCDLDYVECVKQTDSTISVKYITRDTNLKSIEDTVRGIIENDIYIKKFLNLQLDDVIYYLNNKSIDDIFNELGLILPNSKKIKVSELNIPSVILKMYIKKFDKQLSGIDYPIYAGDMSDIYNNVYDLVGPSDMSFNNLYVSISLKYADVELQFILKYFGKPEVVVDRFDFLHCKTWFDFGLHKLFITNEIMNLIAKKTLVVTKESDSAVGEDRKTDAVSVSGGFPLKTIYRIIKKVREGWKISDSQLNFLFVHIVKFDFPENLEDHLILNNSY